MIFNDSFLYLHVPKTGGMSLSKGLLHSLKQRPLNAIPKNHGRAYEKEFAIEGKRHATLKEAQKFFNGEAYKRKLEDFDVIINVIRNPYELERSRFYYLQKGHSWNIGRDQDLAIAGDYKSFIMESKWWFNIEDFYLIDGKKPSNLTILRYENFEEQLNSRFDRFFKTKLSLERINDKGKVTITPPLDREMEEKIYEKYQWIFDSGYYDRLII